MRKPFSLRGCLLAAIALSCFCAPSWAQGNIRTVLFVKVKMGQGKLEGRRQRLCRSSEKSWIRPGVHRLGV